LLELINRQLTEKSLKVEKASAAVIDATIIQTAGSKQRKDKSAVKPHRVKIKMPVGQRKTASTNLVTNNIPAPILKSLSDGISPQKSGGFCKSFSALHSARRQPENAEQVGHGCPTNKLFRRSYRIRMFVVCIICNVVLSSILH